MNITTKINYVRISPRKLNRVIKEIVGKKVNDALKILSFLPHHGAKILYKVVKSAKSNAVNNYKLAEDNLVIAQGYTGQALMMKRFTAMSRGKAGRINKKLSHVSIMLKDEGSNDGAKS
ncbi:MAG: 50S ribosomal protein L22 [Candidatus Margulisbacteria bacterium]|nr:50S ribosomal protein L22 [Candidatus Margulisiibacteriota bacterium]